MPDGTLTGDALKTIRYGVDFLRADLDYPRVPAADDLQAMLAQNFLTPEIEDLDARSAETQRLVGGGQAVVVIPMREPQNDTIGEVLDNMVRLIPGPQIVVLENGSGEAPLRAARIREEKHGVRIVYQSDVYKTIDWDRLLRVLHLSERPKKGKGLAVMSAYLAVAVMVRRNIIAEPLWLIQHDCEVKETDRYRPIEHLALGALDRPTAHYVKIAQPGRTNSTCMAARWTLAAMAQGLPPGVLNPEMDGQIRRRLNDVAHRLGTHMWMLTGEFMLRWSLAKHRLFGSEFLDETMISMFAEDVSSTTGRGCTVQVAAKHPRMDAGNPRRKERMMQQGIANQIALLGFCPSPTSEWDPDFVAEFNRVSMAHGTPMGFIPDSPTAVVGEILTGERIVPSIAMMETLGFIHQDEMSALADRIRSRNGGSRA